MFLATGRHHRRIQRIWDTGQRTEHGIRFPYADFSTDNVVVSVGDPSILGQVARALTSTVIDLSTVPGGPAGLSFARPSR
jgi:hypothetical protein